MLQIARSFLFQLTICWISVCVAISAQAQEAAHDPRPTAWPSSGESINLGPHVDYLKDENGTLTLQDILPGGSHQSHWLRHDALTPNFGFTDDVYWFRMRMTPPVAQSGETWLFRIAYPLLDEIDIHFLPVGDQLNQNQHVQLGDRVPFNDRTLKHRQFLTPIAEPQSPLDIYIRVQSTSSLQVPMEILEERDFLIEDEARVIAYGLLFGAMFVMILYNIIIYLWTRETNYLTYCIYSLGLMILFVALAGLGFQYLWPESLIWHEKSQAVIIPTIMASAVAFNRSFLDLQRQRPSLNSIGKIIFVVSLILTFASMVAPYSLMIKLNIGVLIPGCAFVIYSGIHQWKRGYLPARYYVISWAAVVVGGLMLGVSKAGFLPSNMITDNGVIVGAVAQLMLLSYALADRVNQIKADKERIQRIALNDQKRAAEDLQIALTKAEEANRLKSEFLANISHELRTPLNAIVNLPAGLLRQFDTTFVWSCANCGAQFQSETGPEDIKDPSEIPDCPDCGKGPLVAATNAVFSGNSTEQIHFLKRIESSGRHLLAVVNDLLDISKLEADHMKIYPAEVAAADVLSEVSGTIQTLAEAKGVELIFDESPAGLGLEADRVKLSQILINLIGNAIKFTPEGGQIHIRVRQDMLGEENALRFEVEDTGEGIPEAYLKVIFESFRQVDGSHTRQHHGTGLGLAISRRLVELHRGKIDVASTPGEGSRFWFILPLENASQEQNPG